MKHLILEKHIHPTKKMFFTLQELLQFRFHL